MQYAYGEKRLAQQDMVNHNSVYIDGKPQMKRKRQTANFNTDHPQVNDIIEF